jgi:hypothetical protein
MNFPVMVFIQNRMEMPMNFPVMVFIQNLLENLGKKEMGGEKVAIFLNPC